MAFPKKGGRHRRILLATADRSSTAYLGSALSRAGIPYSDVTNRQLAAARDLPHSPAVVFAASLRHGPAQLTIADRYAAADIPVVVWSSGEGPATGDREAWLLDRLLEQAGALSCAELPVLLEALRIIRHLRQPSSDPLRLRGRTTPLLRRFAAALVRQGVQLAHRSAAHSAWSVGVDQKNHLVLAAGTTKGLTLADPSISASSIALLSARWSTTRPTPDEPIIPPNEEVAMIACPPPRLLSESASKRLGACFGITAGPERLCRSATEAVRFASTLDAPVVLKIVKPKLTDKLAGGAVQTDVHGPSAVRRVYHRLDALGKSSPPTKALGVLVALQISGGARLWLTMEDHRRWGRLVLIGAGDRPVEPAEFVVRAPATSAQVSLALSRGPLTGDRDSRQKLARSIARFSQMIDQLRSSIGRAEIHPLVATADFDEARALDMLIEIAPPD